MMEIGVAGPDLDFRCWVHGGVWENNRGKTKRKAEKNERERQRKMRVKGKRKKRKEKSLRTLG